MKLIAVREYIAYADELEVELLMDKMIELLKKDLLELLIIMKNMR
jgi:hypothetical protein